MGNEDEHHHHAPCGARLDEIGHISEVEIGKYACIHGERVGKILSSECHEGKRHEGKCEQTRADAHHGIVGDFFEPRHIDFVHHQPHTVECTPVDVVETGTVPKSAQEHRYQQVDVLAHLPFAISSESDIHIVAQPKRERNVPSAPKFSDIFRTERKIEVHPQIESHHFAHTNSHVAVAGKVAIELHGEANGSHQQFEAAVGRHVGEHDIGVLRQVIRHHSFFDYANHHLPKTGVDTFCAHGSRVVDLRDEIFGSHNRSGNQAREKRQEEEVVEITARGRHFFFIHIHHITDGAEGVERKSDRSDNVERLEIVAHDIRPGVEEKVGVLKHKQHAQRAAERQPQPHFALALIGGGTDAQCHIPVDNRGGKHHQHIPAAAAHEK